MIDNKMKMILGITLLSLTSSVFAITMIPVNFNFQALSGSLDNPIYSSVSLTLTQPPIDVIGNPPSGTLVANYSTDVRFIFSGAGISAGNMTLNFTPKVGNYTFPAITESIVIKNNVIQPVYAPIIILSPNQQDICYYSVQAPTPPSETATITIACGDN